MKRHEYHGHDGTRFYGRLVDPVTGRQVHTCVTCGDLVWVERAPLYASMMCNDCASHCAECGAYVGAWTEGRASQDHGGRPLCDACWGADTARVEAMQ